MKQYFIDSNWRDGLFADFEDTDIFHFLGLKCRDDKKALYILQEKLHMDLFKKTVLENQPYQVDITFYRDSKINFLSNSIDTIDFYRKKSDIYLNITADIIFSNAYFYIDTSSITIQHFIDQISPIVEQHGKTLVVDL